MKKENFRLISIYRMNKVEMNGSYKNRGSQKYTRQQVEPQTQANLTTGE